MKALFFIGLMALLSGRAIAFADNSAIAAGPEWLALLHYKGGQSQIIDTHFFFSPQGQTDAGAEFAATVEAFKDASSNAQCRFPARLAYIKQALPDETKSFPPVSCPELDEFASKVPLDKVSLAFATEYIPNPTTMMGHLFLKLEGDAGVVGEEKHAAHSLSFFADLNKVKTTAGFIAGSLFTGTDGVYILEPYKVRRDDYLYQGKRSLWEYELKLDATQRKMLGLHIWEMRGINVSYDLRANNCGSAILRLLMVADPAFGDVLYKSYMTPADVLRKLDEKDVLAERTFVPSRLYALRHPDGQGSVIPPKEDATGKGHATTIEAGFQSGSEGNYYTLAINPAYNLLMQRNAYAEQEYEVKLFGLEAGIGSKLDKLNLQRFDLVSFRSFLPVKAQDASVSSALDIGLENSGFGMETGKVFPKAFGGMGWTASPVEAISVYGMLHAGYSYYAQDNVLSLAPEVGIIVREGNVGKAQTNYQKFFNSAEYKYEDRFLARQSFFLTQDVNLNAHYEHAHSSNDNHHDIVGIGLGFSF